ncbi:MAG: DUF917 domain-containing protein [Candidatus Aenigmarchaeota archaeon]|nr:DUF917 domain-containing protein [Candidatus Aenigmarchaeota archaeon]
MRLLNSEDYENLLIGSKILGCGGGGDPNKARKYLEKLSKSKVRMINLDELAENSKIFTVFMIGSSASEEKTPNTIFVAKDELEKIVGKMDAIIPVEIGPGAVFEALNYASEFDLPIVDADIVGGRSAPEVYLETITIGKIKRTPMILVNSDNDMIILKNIDDWTRIEKISRTFATVSGGYAYAVGYPMETGNVKNFLVKNSLTKSIELGNYIKNKNLREFFEKYGGKIIFKGILRKINKENKGGFLIGDIEIDGKDEFTNSELEIWFKNENLVSWINGKPYVTCPDLITITDPEYNGIYNRDLKVGMEVSVIGMPADEIWSSKEGIKIFNPRIFGFNIDYTPIKFNSK